MSVVKSAIQHPVLIAYLEGANNYTWLHFRNGKKQLLAKPISYFETVLGNFVRIHKTLLINPICVEQLHKPSRPKMSGGVQLEGDIMLAVSRRRWNQVVDLLDDRAPASATKDVNSAEYQKLLKPELALRLESGLSIVVVTDNTQSELLLNQVADKLWPRYTVHVMTQGLGLLELLNQLPEEEWPVLILLDARTSRHERLNTLQHIKQNSQLCRLPVILLVAPTDRSVVDGYQRQANSVVSVTNEPVQFVKTIERVGRFWLETATLPSPAGLQSAGTL